jgi:uncharacterized repeat protein (TIGR03803 family)
MTQPRNVTATFAAVPAFTTLKYEVLHEFTGVEGRTPSALIQGSDGTFCGAARWGGPWGYGTIFSMTVNGSVSVIYSNVTEPGGGLLQGSDGAVYGTTAQGGTSGYGSIFRVQTDGSDFAQVRALSPMDGYQPVGLTLGGDGAPARVGSRAGPRARQPTSPVPR